MRNSTAVTLCSSHKSSRSRKYRIQSGTPPNEPMSHPRRKKTSNSTLSCSTSTKLGEQREEALSLYSEGTRRRTNQWLSCSRVQMHSISCGWKSLGLQPAVSMSRGWIWTHPLPPLSTTMLLTAHTLAAASAPAHRSGGHSTPASPHSLAVFVYTFSRI